MRDSSGAHRFAGNYRITESRHKIMIVGIRVLIWDFTLIIRIVKGKTSLGGCPVYDVAQSRRSREQGWLAFESCSEDQELLKNKEGTEPV